MLRHKHLQPFKLPCQNLQATIWNSDNILSPSLSCTEKVSQASSRPRQYADKRLKDVNDSNSIRVKSIMLSH